jgi:hypothetical protein
LHRITPSHAGAAFSTNILVPQKDVSFSGPVKEYK